MVVRVEAAGVSFAEVQLLRGLHPFPPRMPAVPGYDLVGRITAVGPRVDHWKPGDRVAAMPRTGAWQEYVAVPASGLARVPEDIPAATAVALVCNGVTAWQMLHRRARVRPGGTVLVQGAGGGVGSLLTAMAVRHGIRVIGTSSPAKHDALRAMGAEPVDYRGDDVAAAVRELAPDGVDAVFDHLGGRSLDTGWSLLAPGGTLVSFDSSVEGYEPGQWFRPHLPAMRRVMGWKLRRMLGRTGDRRATMYYVRPGDAYREDLEAMFKLVRTGELRPEIAGTYPLVKAADAVTELMNRRTVGKLVLLP
ncbi:zinc-binding dehydrogenase [Streptomyces sp. ST2-7A]|nr:zinc-binding dehydrogenase [Streptomyces sp. ST2-7A]